MCQQRTDEGTAEPASKNRKQTMKGN
jgi:hypothetical protein